MRKIVAIIVIALVAQVAHAACPDGIVDPSEQCDDSNSVNNDGCDSQCRFEGGIVIKKVFSGSSQSFEFDPSYSTSNFFLSNGRVNFSGFLASSRSYSVREVNLSNGWKLDQISCKCFQRDIEGNNTSAPCSSVSQPDLPNRRVLIALSGAELVYCTFINVFEPCTGQSCAVCGNGKVELGEVCDNGAANSDTASGVNACTTQCRRPRCGDGIKQDNEECDSGSSTGDSICSAACTIIETPGNAECGNDIIEAPEECDDANKISGDGCNANCKIERCGDGIINNAANGIATEECDNGEANSDSGTCSTQCKIVQTCVECDHCNDLARELASGCNQGSSADSSPIGVLFVLVSVLWFWGLARRYIRV